MQDSILEQSRAHNPQLGITGILCYSDDLFIQVLEGGRDEVCELYNTIVRDDRHQQVRILSFEEIARAPLRQLDHGPGQPGESESGAAAQVRRTSRS